MRHVDISRYDRSYHPLIAYRERFRHGMMGWWCDEEEELAQWKAMKCRFHKVGPFIVAQFHLPGPAEPISFIASLMNFKAEKHVFGTRCSCIIARKGPARLWTQWGAWADSTGYISWMIHHGHHLPFSERKADRVPLYMNRATFEKRRNSRRHS